MSSKQPLLTCMGEMLIDFIPIEENGATTGFRMCPGGSPLNVAVGLARLGARTAYVSKASTDFFGRFLVKHLSDEGIDTRFVSQDPAFSTLAFVAYEDGEPAYSFYGEGMADTKLLTSDVPAALYEETQLLHIGSISLLRGSTPDAIEAVVRRLAGRALISFDPNIRPGLVRDRAAYEALLGRLFRLANIIKISAADLAWLMPNVPLRAAAAQLRAFGAQLVVVTRGGEGALAWHGSEEHQVPVLPIQFVDAVGAGDAFSSGLLAELARAGALSADALRAQSANTIAEALRFASATSALTCERAGANPPARAQVEARI
jgi:fructokinase